ncbi:lipopolysaccharide kinase InaA family protein [Methylophaga sp.]|uniref:lipopolysaccharide kinase InaA family protein n=1 Tax=Methylophaga sp. TaxID=2024840 RepID=UPI003F69BCD2
MSKEIEAFLAGEAVSVPFDIGHSNERYHCQQILRYLPGRRLVVRAESKGRSLLLKLFKPNKKGRRELAREINGYQACEKAGVPTPERLSISENIEGCLAIAYAFISDAKTFEMPFSEHSDSIQKLIDLMLLCHQAGIYQEDIHPDNLLMTENELFLIDLASVRGKVGKPLAKNTSLNNLALLIAQFQSDQQDRLLQHLERYFDKRGWIFDSKTQQAFEKRLKKVWQKRKTNYLRKCFRSCTMTAYKKTLKFEYAFKRSFFEAAEVDLVNQIDSLVEHGRILKAGNSATVVLVKLAGRDVVVKRYNIKSFSHFLKRCWRPSRAANAWRYGNLMTLIGVPTPEVLGFIEKRNYLLRTTAYLLCGYSAETQELSKVYPYEHPTGNVLTQIKRIFRLMKKYRISHGDLKASNLLLKANAIVELIDLDAMQEHQYESLFNRDYEKDKARFLRNWRLAENPTQIFGKL